MKQDSLFDYKLKLFEKVCDQQTLKEAFKAVKRNRGAFGVDGITVASFETSLEEEIDQLQEELLNWSYKPQPVRRVETSKPGKKEPRKLGIPTVRDRVVQTSIKMVLEPILESTFSDHSYGFRPGRNQRQAVEAAKQIIASGKEYAVDIDLAKFFDRINHDRLIFLLSKYIEDKRILRLVGIILRCGIMDNGLVTSSQEGSVQGSPLSPLLSNLVLDELDKEIEARGHEFCRYADDCNVFVKSQSAADRVMQSLTRFIEKKLKLKVNKEKSKTSLAKYVKFLGITIVSATIAVSAVSMKRAMERIRELTPRGTPVPIEKTVENINKWYTGWVGYYSMTQYPSQLKALESHIRRRLRARIVSQQKRRRFLFRKLKKRGVPASIARMVFCNSKTWALSVSWPVNMAFNNKWFEKTLGLKTFSTKQLPHWFKLSKWVKLS